MHEVYKIISFQISHRVFLGLSASTIRSHKGSVLSFKLFKWWTYTSELITMVGSNFLGGCGVGWWWNEKPLVSFKSKSIKDILYRNIYSYLNKHIFKWNIEKGEMPHSRAEVLWQVPHRQDRPEDKCAGGGGRWARLDLTKPLTPSFFLRLNIVKRVCRHYLFRGTILYSPLSLPRPHPLPEFRQISEILPLSR